MQGEINRLKCKKTKWRIAMCVFQSCLSVTNNNLDCPQAKFVHLVPQISAHTGYDSCSASHNQNTDYTLPVWTFLLAMLCLYIICRDSGEITWVMRDDMQQISAAGFEPQTLHLYGMHLSLPGFAMMFLARFFRPLDIIKFPNSCQPLQIEWTSTCCASLGKGQSWQLVD